MPTVATSEGGGSMPAPNSKMPKGVMGAPLSTLCAAPARVSAAAATRIFGMQRDVGDMKGLSWVRGGKNRNLSHKRRDRGAPRRLPNGIETHGGLCGCRARYAGAMNFPDRIEIRELVTGGDPAAPPVASIVVLHGLGADGSDFVPIAQELDLSAIGPVRFVFPSAPVRPVSINGGYEMRAWYDIYPPGPDGSRREDEAGLRATQAIVQQLLDREAARGVPPERTVLMGFSQGCAMSLLAGLRAPRR